MRRVTLAQHTFSLDTTWIAFEEAQRFSKYFACANPTEAWKLRSAVSLHAPSRTASVTVGSVLSSRLKPSFACVISAGSAVVSSTSELPEVGGLKDVAVVRLLRRCWRAAGDTKQAEETRSRTRDEEVQVNLQG